MEIQVFVSQRGKSKNFTYFAKKEFRGINLHYHLSVEMLISRNFCKKKTVTTVKLRIFHTGLEFAIIFQDQKSEASFFSF